MQPSLPHDQPFAGVRVGFMPAFGCNRVIADGSHFSRNRRCRVAISTVGDPIVKPTLVNSVSATTTGQQYQHAHHKRTLLYSYGPSFRSSITQCRSSKTPSCPGPTLKIKLLYERAHPITQSIPTVPPGTRRDTLPALILDDQQRLFASPTPLETPDPSPQHSFDIPPDR